MPRAEAGEPAPAWLYALASLCLIGGLWAFLLFGAIFVAFGLPPDLPNRLEAVLLTIAPVLLAAAIVTYGLRLWRRGRRRSAVTTIGIADGLVLLIGGWWSGLI